MSYHSYQNSEPLVSLSNLSPKIKIFPYYFQKKFPHTLPNCFLRTRVAEKLVQAANHLPSGLHFIVLDGWRPYELQNFLYKKICQDFTEVEEEKLAKYVAFPSKDIETASPHLTGGAVDLTIASGDGWLHMGTDFDEFIDKTKTDWYEHQQQLSAEESQFRDNRRLLKEVMEKVGFTNYAPEWWHFDFGNQNWAQCTKQTAIYKGILASPC